MNPERSWRSPAAGKTFDAFTASFDKPKPAGVTLALGGQPSALFDSLAALTPE